MNQQAIIDRYLPATLSPAAKATAFAPSNIALCKYWGKRDAALNLPTNASLSVSLGELGTTTTLQLAAANSLSLNGVTLSKEDMFFKKVFAFVELFRRGQDIPLAIETVNTIPTAAGLASSASGFAALTLAINACFSLNLPLPVLSAFARMGSGSASRSLYHGFVEWHKGEQADGMDSFAEPLATQWPAFRIGIVTVSATAKKIQSREGMNRTVSTSQLYEKWPVQAANDLITLKKAIAAQDFSILGETAEHNALSMHATMISAWPPVLYWQPESVAVMQRVWDCRQNGLEVYLTMDAGPNVKLLFLQDQEASIKAKFPDMTVIAPFSVTSIP